MNSATLLVQVLEISVFVCVDFFLLQVFMKLSHLALSQGFARRLMLAIIRCWSITLPYSAEAY